MAGRSRRTVAPYSLLSKSEPSSPPSWKPNDPADPLFGFNDELSKLSVAQLGDMLKSLEAEAPSTSQADLRGLGDRAALVLNHIRCHWEKGRRTTVGVDAIKNHLRTIVPANQRFPNVEVIEAEYLQAKVSFTPRRKGPGIGGVPMVSVTSAVVRLLTPDEVHWLLAHEWGHVDIWSVPAVTRANKSYDNLTSRSRGVQAGMLKRKSRTHQRHVHVVSREAVTNAILRRREMLADQWATPDGQA